MIEFPHLEIKCSTRDAFMPLVEYSESEENREIAERYLEALYQYIIKMFSSVTTLEHAKRTTFDNLNYYVSHFNGDTPNRVNEYYRRYK